MYLIRHDGPKGASAYSLSLLAGCAGFASADEFVEACRDDEALLDNTVRQAEPFMHEEGASSEAAYREVKMRMQALKLEIAVDIPAQRNLKAKQEFEGLLRAGQGAVLVQASRLDAFRRTMTTAALALATSAALALASVPQEVHAEGFDRFAKDALGGAVGAVIGGQFGGGNGRTAMQVVGALIGVGVAESIQNPKQPDANAVPSPQQSEADAMRQAAVRQSGVVTGGSEALSPDKRDKMSYLERNTLASRDEYAKSLVTAQEAEDSRMLAPRDQDAYDRAVSANSTAQAYGQRYRQARSDFDNAYEYLAGRGYDVREFSYTYLLTQKQVTTKDASYRERERPVPEAYAAKPQRAESTEPSF